MSSCLRPTLPTSTPFRPPRRRQVLTSGPAVCHPVSFPGATSPSGRGPSAGSLYGSGEELLAEAVFLDLAGWCHRELSDDPDMARHLIARQRAGEPVPDTVLGEARAVTEPDEHGHGLAVVIVRHADHAEVEDLRQGRPDRVLQ